MRKALDERALKAAQREFRFNWPWLSKAWEEYRIQRGITDLGEMPMEPFEAAIEAYLKVAK